MIEFRVLQLVTSHVAGDRVTLAVVHWDGSELRVAQSMRGLRFIEKAHHEGIKVAVSAVVKAAQNLARSMRNKSTRPLSVGLAHLFPVREGEGGALSFSPVMTSRTKHGKAHFERLCKELRLRKEPAPKTKKKVTTKQVSSALVAWGEKLRDDPAAHDRLFVHHQVADKLPYESPLSWMNGKWHHAIPVSLDGVEPADIAREVQRIYGVIGLSMPKDDVPVLVAAVSGNALGVNEGVELLTQCAREAAGDAEVVVAESHGDGELELGSFFDRVRRDVYGEGDVAEPN